MSPSDLGYDKGFWTSPLIRQHIKSKTGIAYSKSRCCELMKEWGFSVKRPRMSSVKADEGEQQVFIDHFAQLMVFLWLLSSRGVKLKILFTDEASLRRDGTLHRGWFKQGETPEIPESGGRFESVKLIGAVDQQDGSFHVKMAPEKITLAVYADFLMDLSDKHKDKLLVIVHDNAPWHGSKNLAKLLGDRGVENILVVRLPKYSPDMNPCEKLWKWMRETVTHCRYYDNLGDLKQAVWRFYRRAHNQKEQAKIRFKTEKPLFKLTLKACRRGLWTFFCFWNMVQKLTQ